MSGHCVRLVTFLDRLKFAFLIYPIVIFRQVLASLDPGHGFLFPLLLLVRKYIFLDGVHECFIFTHLFQRFSDILQQDETWVAFVQLEELSKVHMFFSFRADTLVLEHLPKVFCFQESHVEVLRLSLHILRKDDI